MECAQMNLEQLINRRKQQRKGLKLWEVEKAGAFCLEAFKKLEDLGIAHCDIKPENILVLNEEKMIMKICDVGSCKVVSKEKVQ